MKILFIGDIVGKPGRRIVIEKLNGIINSYDIDLVIANCENAAAGFGITPSLADELFSAGAEVLTSGNHKEIENWKMKERINKTKLSRKDLYKKYLKKQ